MKKVVDLLTWSTLILCCCTRSFFFESNEHASLQFQTGQSARKFSQGIRNEQNTFQKAIEKFRWTLPEQLGRWFDISQKKGRDFFKQRKNANLTGHPSTHNKFWLPLPMPTPGRIFCFRKYLAILVTFSFCYQAVYMFCAFMCPFSHFFPMGFGNTVVICCHVLSPAVCGCVTVFFWVFSVTAAAVEAWTIPTPVFPSQPS